MSQLPFAKALDLHSQGRLAEAEELYRRVLASNPDAFDAYHMLGVLRAQQGHNEEAYDLIEVWLYLESNFFNRD